MVKVNIVSIIEDIGMYAVLTVRKSVVIAVKNCDPPLTRSTTLSWAEGMVGAIPVFHEIKDAHTYSEEQADGAPVVELEV